MKRARAHSVWFALGILAILAVWLYFDLKKPTREPNESPKVSELIGMKPEDVTRIEVSASGRGFALVKSGSAWKIEKPVQAAADAETVKRALEDLLTQSSDYVMRDPPGDLSRWGLAKPKKTIVLSAGSRHLKLEIGDLDPGKSSVFTRHADTGIIFLAGSYSVENLTDKTADDFRDKTVLSISRDTIERVRLIAPNRTIVLVRSGDQWRLAEPVQVAADEFAADGIVDTLASLKADRFAEAGAKDLARYGLDKPRLLVEIEARGGAQYGVRFGKDVSTDGPCYAARTNSSDVVEVSRTTFEALNKDVAALRSRKIVDADTDKVERLAVVSTKATWEARKKGSYWEFVRPNPGKKADAIDVDNIILDVTSSADRWVVDSPDDAALAGYGLLKPQITVTLTLKGGKTKKLEVGKKSSAGDYFVRGTDTGSSVFATSSYIIERLQTMPKQAK